MIATCCDTPMLLDFTKGHWLSFYRGCLTGPVRPLDMLVMTKDKPEGVTPPDDAPNYATHSKGRWGGFCCRRRRWGFAECGGDGDAAAKPRDHLSLTSAKHVFMFCACQR